MQIAFGQQHPNVDQLDWRVAGWPLAHGTGLGETFQIDTGRPDAPKLGGGNFHQLRHALGNRSLTISQPMRPLIDQRIKAHPQPRLPIALGEIHQIARIHHYQRAITAPEETPETQRQQPHARDLLKKDHIKLGPPLQQIADHGQVKEQLTQKVDIRHGEILHSKTEHGFLAAGTSSNQRHLPAQFLQFTRRLKTGRGVKGVI